METMETFDKRFVTRAQVEHYRDRYRTGKRARTDQRERAALRAVLSGVGRLGSSLDLPCGTGRLSGVLGEFSERIILADSSRMMLQVAGEEHPTLAAEYLLTDAEDIQLDDASVDLVFSHRFLPHINDAAQRVRMVAEMARVSAKFVLLTYYPPGFRSRVRWTLRSTVRTVARRDQLATVGQFLEEVSSCGLQLAHREVLRTFPPAGYFLFQRSC